MKTQHTLSAADPFAAAPVSTGPDRGVYPETKSSNMIPVTVKVLYTAFMAVLVPVNWSKFGASIFLCFRDVALFLALIGVWCGKRIFASMAALLTIVYLPTHFTLKNLFARTEFVPVK